MLTIESCTQMFERESNKEKNLEKAVKEAKAKARREAAAKSAAPGVGDDTAELEQVRMLMSNHRMSHCARLLRAQRDDDQLACPSTAYGSISHPLMQPSGPLHHWAAMTASAHYHQSH